MCASVNARCTQQEQWKENRAKIDDTGAAHSSAVEHVQLCRWVSVYGRLERVYYIYLQGLR